MPHKTCTLNCIYCECGQTTHLTLDRKAYVPVAAVMDELALFLSSRPRLDFITFSGSGEPTLHSGLAEIVRFVKDHYPQYRVALLTNATLFNHSALRNEVAEIDLVVASLDAATEAVFNRINRPHPGLNIHDIKDGLLMLAKEYTGRLWIEVFLAPGVNDSNDEIEHIKETISLIGPEKVQLNTLDRPGTENWVKPLDTAAMARVAACIQTAEWIGTPKNHRPETTIVDFPSLFIGAIRRRPCTIVDLANMFGLSDMEVLKHLEMLVEKDIVRKKEMPRGIFYFAR